MKRQHILAYALAGVIGAAAISGGVLYTAHCNMKATLIAEMKG